MFNYSFVLQISKGPHFSWTSPTEHPPGLRHEPIAELTVPQDPYLHSTTCKNSIFVQKMAINKTAWMNTWVINDSDNLATLISSFVSHKISNEEQSALHKDLRFQ